MAVSGASFRKPLLSSFIIVSLREARECIVLINSKTLPDSPDASRRWKYEFRSQSYEERTVTNFAMIVYNMHNLSNDVIVWTHNNMQPRTGCLSIFELHPYAGK